MYMKLDKTILITGGAGFIGSHVVKRFVTNYPSYHIINLDKLTYCGDLFNVKEVSLADNYTFILGDICDNTVNCYSSDVFALIKSSEDTILNIADEVNEKVNGSLHIVSDTLISVYYDTVDQSEKNDWGKIGDEIY